MFTAKLLAGRLAKALTGIATAACMLNASASVAQENTITVRMSGTGGDEQATLTIGGKTIKTWTVSDQMDNYSVVTDVTGNIQVAFINDARMRNLRIDYLSVNDEIRQAEDQEINTGVWDRGCGKGSFSETLHCNGYIDFGSTKTSSQSSSSTGNCEEVCIWYNDAPRPLCKNTRYGWGWENRQTCIARKTCENQWGGSGIVSGCDDAKDKELCASLNNKTFFSDALFEAGRSVTGEVLGHRSVGFAEGILTIAESDYIIKGNYQCENGDVIASYTSVENQVLAFNKDYSGLTFDSHGGESVEYSLAKQKETSDCSLVKNATYEVDPAELAAVTLPRGAEFVITFDDSQGANMTLGTQTFRDAIFDCNIDGLHVHRSAADTQPLEISVVDNGATLVVPIDEFTNWRFNRKIDACIEIYAPVCAVEEKPIACLTAPCPTGLYKTYGNECLAKMEGVIDHTIEFGECGKKEGAPYFGTGVCTMQYDPVCAAVTDHKVCDSAPCPNRHYKTFSNACVARVAQAQILSSEACPKELEDTRITDPLFTPVACTRLYDPVCAKAKANIQCIKAPCPSSEYKTYSNECVANGNSADVTWEKQQCGVLEGMLSGSEPPVHVVDTLARTHKKVSAKAQIEDNTLIVSLSYLGCESQHFDFQVARKFFDPMTDNGATGARYAFIPMIEDACTQPQTSELRYDLAPLKAHYQQTTGRDSGIISLQGLIDYRF